MIVLSLFAKHNQNNTDHRLEKKLFYKTINLVHQPQRSSRRTHEMTVSMYIYIYIIWNRKVIYDISHHKSKKRQFYFIVNNGHANCRLCRVEIDILLEILYI